MRTVARHLSLLLLVATLSGCGVIGSNWGQVDERVFRSGQMSAKKLGAKIEEHGLRSVVNLRGHQPNDDWYQEEVQACEERGVSYYPIRWSARRLPYRADVLRLLEAFDHGPYPMLIHCYAGADRTGLAVVLYRHYVLGEPIDEADSSLTFWYGHVAIPGVGAYDMDRFIHLYRDSGAPDLRTFLETYDHERPPPEPLPTP